jgi:dolichol-phosphate mannosyltransferase
VIDGLHQVESDVVGVIDADLQHPPSVMRDLLQALDGGADLAVASRYVRGGTCHGWGLLRRVISKGAILLAHLLLPPTRPVSDPMSGCFAFRRSAVTTSKLRAFGYKILLEILVLGHPQRIVEVPYSFRLRSRGQSKLTTTQQVDYLKQLFSLVGRSGEWKRFVKFALVGASGVLVNMGLLWLLTEVAGLLYLISASISIECSIISNFVLNDYFTFPDRRSQGFRDFLRHLGKFNVVSMGGIGINLLVLWLLSDLLGINYLLSNLCGIAVAMMWNYLVNSWWTWK